MTAQVHGIAYFYRYFLVSPLEHLEVLEMGETKNEMGRDRSTTGYTTWVATDRPSVAKIALLVGSGLGVYINGC